MRNIVSSAFHVYTQYSCWSNEYPRTSIPNENFVNVRSDNKALFDAIILTKQTIHSNSIPSAQPRAATYIRYTQYDICMYVSYHHHHPQRNDVRAVAGNGAMG